MKKIKSEFADGAEKQGYDRVKAEELWELIVKLQDMVLTNLTLQLMP